MLYRDLKKVANDSLLNPSKPDMAQKILLSVGNPRYWCTRALELITQANQTVEGSTAYHKCLTEAITLLILARAKTNEKPKVDKKTRKRTTGPDSSVPQTS